MRRTAFVMFVMLIIAGGGPALLGGKKTPPAWCTGCIAVEATFRNGDFDAITSTGTNTIPGIINNGYFNFDGSSTVGIKFNWGNGTSETIYNVFFAVGSPPQDPATLSQDEAICMTLTYVWNPTTSSNTENRLMFHSFQEKSYSDTSYAVVTCTVGSDGHCTKWTIAPDIGVVQTDGTVEPVCPGNSGAVGALWKFVSGKRGTPGTSERDCCYSLPHTITVTRK